MVSAIAIFGTFQLFDVANWGTNKFIDVLLPSNYFVGYLIVYSALLAVSVLVAMFVIHFVLRSYWVGLVGLNSVFPDYGLEESAYSKIYTEKLLEELPKLKNSIESVDQLCSVIFASAFAMMMIYTYAALIFGILLLIYNTFAHLIPFTVAVILIVVFALFFILQMVIASLANLERYKENERVQTFYFLTVKYSSILLLGPLYRANMQITMSFGSNYKKNKNIVRLLFVFVVMGVALSAYKISETNIIYLIDNTRFQNESRAFRSFYADQNESYSFVLTPQIPSRITDEKALPLFIPIFSNESRLIDYDLCEEPELDDELTKQERRSLRGLGFIECYQRYHSVALNGQELSLQFMRYDQAYSDQYGVLAFVPLEGLEAGQYDLTVTKTFADSNSHWKIPFYYSAK